MEREDSFINDSDELTIYGSSFYESEYKDNSTYEDDSDYEDDAESNINSDNVVSSDDEEYDDDFIEYLEI